MMSFLRKLEDACGLRLMRRAPHGAAERGSLRLLVLLAVSLGLAWLPGIVGDLGHLLALLTGLVLPWFLLVLLWRWITRRLLWTVRNRIIIVCLLMGVAPVVLFGTLAAIAAYTFAGQFATDIALFALEGQLERLHDRDSARAAAMGRTLTGPSVPPGHAGPQRRAAGSAAHAETWIDGRLIPGGPANSSFAAAGLPAWAPHDFQGVVDVKGRLYLCAILSGDMAGHTMLTLSTQPLDQAELEALGRNLGSIIVYRASPSEQGDPNGLILAQGGDTGPASHFFDRKVYFTAPLHVTNWQTGADVPVMIGVVSRPTLLYARLFYSSVHIGRLVSDGLIVITLLFTCIELLALLLALRLSRTLTRSIGELYRATAQVDRGNLAHRVPVERQDQLGVLATSFNTMTNSLAELLVQQREKDRMQSELEIAQQVQANLFPQSLVHLPGFELFGLCQPARTVSGDYYDFILSGEGRICFALGDISGKGISAALLMASLHSAVRAYTAAERGQMAPGEQTMPSPGRLLALLNHHLYTSTQPEKYATLFLACYESHTRRLTYSNGGHLTPCIVCADGSMQRLECGGSVVGLLDSFSYPEATVELHPGDLVVAYSDGMTEPENDFEEFGEQRLLALLQQNRHEPLPALAEHLMRALRQWIGDREQPDDMTVMLARQL